MADPIRGMFRQPFKQQVAAFRLRLGDLVPTSRWDDISRAQHDRAFMVAGATKADLLADLASAVDKAITDGTSLEEFRRDFRQIVERRGWHGWTGEGTAKGEAWRTKVIYRTNLATTRAAGRYAQHFGGAFKYLVYRHSGAEDYRPEHKSWDGLILPVDHPFWRTHYPINGWGCACFVRGARTLAGAIRVGGKPDVTLPPDWAERDPATGAPAGIDKGWDYAPGASVDDTVRAMTRKTIDWPYVLGKEFMANLPSSTVDDFATSYRAQPSLQLALRRFSERALHEHTRSEANKVMVEPLRTMGRLTSNQVDQISQVLGKRVDGFDFTLAPNAVRHVFKKHGAASAEARRGQRAISPDDFGLLPGWLNQADDMTMERGRLKITLPLGNETIVMVFDHLNKRRMLSLVTMYVRSRDAT